MVFTSTSKGDNRMSQSYQCLSLSIYTGFDCKILIIDALTEFYVKKG